MNKSTWLFILLLFLGAAQAQLVPKGMVIPNNIEPQDPPSEEIPVADTVAYLAIAEDSASIYQKDYNYNKEKMEHFQRLSSIASWSGIAVAMAGVCMAAFGLTESNGSFNNGWVYGGAAVMAVSFVGFGFSWVYDKASSTYKVRANFFSQKMTDYQRRHPENPAGL